MKRIQSWHRLAKADQDRDSRHHNVFEMKAIGMLQFLAPLLYQGSSLHHMLLPNRNKRSRKENEATIEYHMKMPGQYLERSHLPISMHLSYTCSCEIIMILFRTCTKGLKWITGWTWGMKSNFERKVWTHHNLHIGRTSSPLRLFRVIITREKLAKYVQRGIISA